jgi:hypothetical protein
MNGKTVEQMMSQHGIAIADGREVVAAVPTLELIQQTQEPRGICVSEIDSETRGAVGEVFGRAQKGLR